MKFVRKIVGALVFIFSCTAYAELLADSVADYSSIQGQYGWYYGYYDGSYNPSVFILMRNYYDNLPGYPSNYWGVDNSFPSPYVYTFLSQMGGHPNGRITSGGRDSIEQWAVRRWVSDYTGQVSVTIHVADNDTTSGNGILGHVYENQNTVDLIDIANGDTLGYTNTYVRNIVIGDYLDFAIDPKNSQDANDRTIFTITISAVPEPNIALLFIVGFIVIAVSLRNITSRCT